MLATETPPSTRNISTQLSIDFSTHYVRDFQISFTPEVILGRDFARKTCLGRYFTLASEQGEQIIVAGIFMSARVIEICPIQFKPHITKERVKELKSALGVHPGDLIFADVVSRIAKFIDANPHLRVLSNTDDVPNSLMMQAIRGNFLDSQWNLDHNKKATRMALAKGLQI